jgi:hypothetical protein
VGVKLKTIDRDLGLKKLLGAGRLFRRGDVRIGVFGELGSDLVLRASVHEFGAPSRNIPQRSFLRATIDEKRSDLIARAARGAGRVLDAVSKGANAQEATRKELDLLGLFAVRAVRERIRSNIPPPLKPETIEAKGSSVALIDTGRMIQAITHKVELT